MDVRSLFVINTQVYLQCRGDRLLARCRDAGMSLIRRRVEHVDEAWLSPHVTAVFNCTGLGSYRLGGVEDKTMYPTRGQVVLVEQPIQPLRRMYFRSPRRVDKDITYIFQRPLAGGIILGGCREDGSWDGEPDPDLARDIMRHCCSLAPELGRREDLKVIRHGVGLRPSRKAGPRMEVEGRPSRRLLVHNYGASGAGYQASWGMASHVVTLLQEALEERGTSVAKL